MGKSDMGKRLTDHKLCVDLTKLSTGPRAFFEGVEGAVFKHAQVY